eukprot:381540_1
MLYSDYKISHQSRDSLLINFQNQNRSLKTRLCTKELFCLFLFQITMIGTVCSAVAFNKLQMYQNNDDQIICGWSGLSLLSNNNQFGTVDTYDDSTKKAGLIWFYCCVSAAICIFIAMFYAIIHQICLYSKYNLYWKLIYSLNALASTAAIFGTVWWYQKNGKCNGQLGISWLLSATLFPVFAFATLIYGIYSCYYRNRTSKDNVGNNQQYGSDWSFPDIDIPTYSHHGHHYDGCDCNQCDCNCAGCNSCCDYNRCDYNQCDCNGCACDCNGCDCNECDCNGCIVM